MLDIKENNAASVKATLLSLFPEQIRSFIRRSVRGSLMKRFLAFLLSATITVVIGCGYGNYEKRLQLTEARIKDEMTLDQVLNDPPRGEFEKLNIYVRPPKPLQKTDEFRPVDLTKAVGLFDVEASFVDMTPAKDQAEGQASRGYSLHILARREQEQDPTKEQPNVEAPATARRPFLDDLREVLFKGFSPEEAEAATEAVSRPIWPRSDPPRPQTYERMQINANDGSLVQVYLYRQEAGPAKYDVALIWVFPGGQAPATTGNPVDLTLGTFAVGNAASQRFRGVDEDFGGPGDGGGQVIAF